jgi:hypothetical protein
MKNYAFILVISLFLLSCKSKKLTISQSEINVPIIKNSVTNTKNSLKKLQDTVRIANDSLEYEVIIIDPGFSTWLVSRSFPRGYHSQSFMENKNYLYITEWNNRVLQPHRYNPNLYEMRIDYDPNINYGYEVNYLIYNYMIYFQNTYKQNLYGFVPIR